MLNVICVFWIYLKLFYKLEKLQNEILALRNRNKQVIAINSHDVILCGSILELWSEIRAFKDKVCVSLHCDCDFSLRLFEPILVNRVYTGESPSARQLSVSLFPIVPPSRFNHCLSERFACNTVASCVTSLIRIIKNRIKRGKIY